jgi:hypothetical protein
MHKHDVQVHQVTDVWIFELDRIGGSQVQGLLLVKSREEVMVFNRYTGLSLTLQSSRRKVGDALFALNGPAVIITGLGAAQSQFGFVAGTHLHIRGRTYEIVFALDGLHIAKIGFDGLDDRHVMNRMQLCNVSNH